MISISTQGAQTWITQL